MHAHSQGCDPPRSWWTGGGSLGPGFLREYGTFVGREWCGGDGATVRECDAWHVDAPPAYNNYTFLTFNNSIVVARANSGATTVNYFNFRAATIGDAVLSPPPSVAGMPCPVVGH